MLWNLLHSVRNQIRFLLVLCPPARPFAVASGVHFAVPRLAPFACERCWGGSERNSPRRPSYSMSPEAGRPGWQLSGLSMDPSDSSIRHAGVSKPGCLKAPRKGNELEGVQEEPSNRCGFPLKRNPLPVHSHHPEGHSLPIAAASLCFLCEGGQPNQREAFCFPGPRV